MKTLKRFKHLISEFIVKILRQFKYLIINSIAETRKLTIKRVLGLVVGISAIGYAGASIPAKISISPTNSVGYHIFFYKKNFRKCDLKKDTMVVVPLYTRVIDNCWPCLAVKYIKCNEGDNLRAEAGSFFCNNVFLGSAKSHSKKGMPVEAFTYNGTILKNYFFDMGTDINSYDSRYTGLVSKNEVKAVAIPFF